MIKKSEQVTVYSLLKSKLPMDDAQRGLVWKDKQKEKLITDMLNKTWAGFSSKFVVCEYKNKGRTLLDGQQRLDTIRSFIKGEYSPKGLIFEDLNNSLKELFLSHTCEIIVLKQEDEESYEDFALKKNSYFHSVNNGSTIRDKDKRWSFSNTEKSGLLKRTTTALSEISSDCGGETNIYFITNSCIDYPMMLAIAYSCVRCHTKYPKYSIVTNSSVFGKLVDSLSENSIGFEKLTKDLNPCENKELYKFIKGHCDPVKKKSQYSLPEMKMLYNNFNKVMKHLFGFFIERDFDDIYAFVNNKLNQLMLRKYEERGLLVPSNKSQSNDIYREIIKEFKKVIEQHMVTNP